jgi:hypothetical protein
MEEEPEERPEVRLYRLAWDYYMHQATCITRDDYKVLQEKIGYPETFEEHQKRLLQGVPTNTSKMVEQIKRFIDQYVVFKESRYADRIELLIETIKKDPVKHKQAAFHALLSQFKDRDPEAEIPEDLPAHPPLFEMNLGNIPIVLPTYGNPMMTALYSLLFVCFQHFLAEDQSALDFTCAPLLF